MDKNLFYGQLILQKQWLPNAVVNQAYRATQGRTDIDVLDTLIAQGALTLQQATFLRQEAQRQRPSDSALVAYNPHASSDPDFPTFKHSSEVQSAITVPQPTAFPSSSASLDIEDLSATARTSSNVINSGSSFEAPQSSAIHSKSGEQPQRFGDYRIIREISRGGMGAVYLAFSEKLQKEVALKTLLAGRLAGEEAILRFRLEAQSTARLSHPNIVAVYDVGEHDGHHFLVMDYIEGQSLKALTQERGSFSNGDAATTTLKIAKALSFAHKRGILHRDIKPENVLVRSDDDEVLLTDFGLAKDMNSGPGEGLTVTGQIIGTPEFMSPEQADGRLGFIDQRSDIYSVGATLYHLLTGQPPFVGETLTNILKAIMTDEARAPSKLVPSVDRDLEIITLKCLEKDLDQRYQSTEELVEDLQRFLADEPIQAKAPSTWERIRRWRRRNRSTLRVAFVAALLLLGVLLGPQALELQKAWIQQRELRSFEVRLEEYGNSQRNRWETVLTALETELASSNTALKENSTDVKAWRDKLRLVAEETELSRVDKDLRQTFPPPDWITAEEHEKSLEQVKEKLEPARYGARAALARSLLAERLQLKEEADLQRLKALSLDPDSENSKGILLTISKSLLKQNSFDQSLTLSKRLLQSQSSDIKGRAALVAAEALFRLGRVDESYETLKQVPTGSLSNKEDLEMKRDLERLGSRLRGVGSVPVPSGTRLAVSKQSELLAIAPDSSNDPRKLQISRVVFDTRRGQLADESRFDCRDRVAHWDVLDRGDEHLLWTVSTEGRVRIYDLDSPKPTQRYEIDSGGLLKGALLRGLGHANDNDDLDGLFRRHDQAYWFFCFDIGTPREKIVQAPPMNGSWSDHVCFFDTDGDQKNQLIMGENAWRTFALASYDTLTGTQIASPQRMTIGSLDHWSLNRVFNRKELLFSVDRNFYYDVGVVYGPDLSPHLPDGIWSLPEGQSKPKLIVSRPFEERDGHRFGMARRIAPLFHRPSDELVYTQQLRPSEPYSMVFELKVNRLTMPGLTARFSFIDFDKDGDAEIYWTTRNPDRSYTLHIRGLPPLAKSVKAEPLQRIRDRQQVQMDLIATLLAGKQYQRALTLTENLLEAPGLSDVTKVSLKLSLARIQQAKGNYKEARTLALAAAEASPFLREEGLRVAMSCADELSDFQSAKRDLEMLRACPTLAQTERDLLVQRRDAYQSLIDNQKLLQLNRDSLSKSSLPLYSRAPWTLEASDAGLLFQGRCQSQSDLALPVRFNGRSFRMSCQLKILRLQFYTGFKLGFHSTTRDQDKAQWGFNFQTGANGDNMTWDRRIGFESRDMKFVPNDYLIAYPTDELTVNLTYRHDNGLLRMEARCGAKVFKQSMIISPRLGPGLYELRLEAKARAAGLRYFPQAWGADILLKNVTFSGGAGIFDIVEESGSHWGRGGVALIRKDWSAASRHFQESLRDPKERASSNYAQFGLAIALARSGQDLAAKQIFRALRERQRGWYEESWRRWIYALKDEELRVMAELERREGKLEAQIQQAFAANKLFLAALLSTLLDKGSFEGSSQLGEIWFAIGDLKRSESVLRRGKESAQGRVLAILGLIAYHRSDFKSAVKYWKGFDNWDGGSRSLVHACRTRALYILKHPDALFRSRFKEF